MSRLKSKDMRSLTVAELQQKRNEWENELQELRNKKVSGQLDKPHFFKLTRRQIAQALTIEQEKKNEPVAKRSK
jgi:ribosomal protein L29